MSVSLTKNFISLIDWLNLHFLLVLFLSPSLFHAWSVFFTKKSDLLRLFLGFFLSHRLYRTRIEKREKSLVIFRNKRHRSIAIRIREFHFNYDAFRTSELYNAWNAEEQSVCFLSSVLIDRNRSLSNERGKGNNTSVPLSSPWEYISFFYWEKSKITFDFSLGNLLNILYDCYVESSVVIRWYFFLQTNSKVYICSF